MTGRIQQDAPPVGCRLLLSRHCTQSYGCCGCGRKLSHGYIQVHLLVLGAFGPGRGT